MAPFRPRTVGRFTLQQLEYRPGGGNPQVIIQATSPNEVGVPSGLPQLQVSLVGASGRRYSSGGRSSSGSGRGEFTNWNMTFTFGEIAEKLTSIGFETKERGAPKSLGRFRFRDIPLPHEGIFVARAKPVATPRPGPLPAIAPAPAEPPKLEGPFRQAGGATLLSPVQVQAKPAPAGVLLLGLSAAEGDDWGPIRWTDLEVHPDGTATLEGLRPGKYRVFRSYRPGDIPNLPGPGNWTGAETQVQLEAGKKFTLPPLSWQKDAAPSTAVKPSTAKPPIPRPGKK